MEPPRQTRWRRREARLRSDARRVVAIGAVVGLAAGIVAQAVIGTPDDSIEWLVRGSLVLPAIVYACWWLVGPRTELRHASPQESVQHAPTDDRIDRITTVFDDAAVPRARRERIVAPDDERRQDALRASIRRDEAPQPDPRSFGVRRPKRRTPDADAR